MRCVLLLALLTGKCGASVARAGDSSDALVPETNASHGGLSRASVSFGDLSCMRWTGGSCSVLSCKADRGNTVCDAGYCMCLPGQCANAEGVCVSAIGKWVGDYAIKFENAHDSRRAYLGDTVSRWTMFGPSQENPVTHYLASVPTSEPRWKIAITSGGHVRFESKLEPGHVMSIWENRRRRTDGRRRSMNSRRRMNLLQESRLVVNGTETSRDPQQSDASGALPLRPSLRKSNGTLDLATFVDDEDYWPVLIDFRYAHPLDVTFRVRWTAQDGGGLEIWDPQTFHALASSQGGWLGWMSGDRVASQGVSECGSGPGFFSMMFGSNCNGRQLVEFEPPLPQEATTRAPRDYIYEVSVLSWWQFLILFCCCGGCVGACVIAGTAAS